MSASSGAVSPWRRQDFRIAWTAGFVNNTGDWILLVALPVFVFVETGSGTSTAFLFVAQLAAAAIVGPIGGAIVDRSNLKVSLITTNLAQAAMVLPLLAVSADRIWPAYLVMAAQSALNQINDPTNIALIPRVVDRGQLTEANAALAGGESVARLVGAPLGGLLVAWTGLTAVVLIDAASFIAVAIAATRLATDTSPDTSAPAAHRTVREGLRQIRANPPLGALVSIQSLSQVAQGTFVVVFVVFVVDTLGDDGAGLGAIRGVMAVGALAGSAAIARLAPTIEPARLYAAGLIGMGAVALLFWNAPAVTTDLWLYVLLFSLSGLPGAAVRVGLFTTLQTSCPPAALGRVAGILSAGDAIGVTSGSIAAGLLVDRLPLDVLLNTQAAVYLATGAVAFVVVRPPLRP